MGKDTSGVMDDYRGGRVMIWYFLAGFIAGAVFILMTAGPMVDWIRRRFPDDVRRAEEAKRHDERSSGDSGHLD